jgi:hypothetical protein
MFNIFEEITWPQFTQLSHIYQLPLQEQVNYYNQYLFQLSEARQNWISTQNKAPHSNIVGFLAQEESYINSDEYLDYYSILQEDGSFIYVTV